MTSKKPQSIDNLTFRGYWDKINSQPKIFRDTIIKECKCSYETFYKWVNGTTTPRPLEQEKISEITGVPMEKLFPKK